jgi:hypothetical protein
MNVLFLNRKISIFELILIFLLSFTLRASVFHFFLKNNERFCQSDSLDYHMSAVCMQHGNGMTRLDNQKPIYWRTPGYPAFLAAMYSCVGLRSDMVFANYAEHHIVALWMQIFLSAFMPLLVLLLALIITQSYAVARLAAYCMVIHLGFVLASGYLLTDAIASLFFILFLIFLYQVLSRKQNTNFVSENPALILAAISLALYTWMRPMGQFISLIAAGMLLLSKGSLKEKLFKAFLFLALFMTLLFPWFWRNYQLTSLFFFCPLFGLYFNVFNAPRIIAYLSGIPLEIVHKQFTVAAGYTHAYEALRYKALNIPYQLCSEYICLSTALPVLLAHPFIFIIDWIREVCKTTFDLFSYQLVAFHQECFKWDPMVEFLLDKLSACLWTTSLPLAWRIIAWGEVFFYIVLWSGIFAGVFVYIVKPGWMREKFSHKNCMWLFSAIIVCSVVCQTGGFGYARLRLPIEPLLIIGSIWYWWELLCEREAFR